MPPKLLPRKLLIASIGVATINYVAVACGGSTTPGDTTLKEGGSDTAQPPTSGNLPAPPPPTSANLPAPPPIDASDGASDAGDASDGD